MKKHRLAVAISTICTFLMLGALAVPAEARETAPRTTDPVILAAGSFLDENANGVLTQRLRAAGFDVHVYTIPNPAARLETTAPSLAEFVDRVRETTGAAKVDVVNHSQSGLLTGTAARVGDI